MHRALEVAKKYTLRYPYFLKMDVKKFYDSVSHSILQERLRHILKDKDFLWLLDTILEISPCPTTGLPVGTLTSQYFANFFLSGLDHYAKEKLQIKPYLRYMDDFLLFAEEKQDLTCCQRAMEEYLPQELHLQWKEQATILAPVTEGVPFLGFRLFPGYTKMQKKNWNRFKKKFRKKQEEFQQGKISLEKLKLSIETMTNYIMQAQTARLRGEFFLKNSWDL